MDTTVRRGRWLIGGVAAGAAGAMLLMSWLAWLRSGNFSPIGGFGRPLVALLLGAAALTGIPWASKLLAGWLGVIAITFSVLAVSFAAEQPVAGLLVLALALGYGGGAFVLITSDSIEAVVRERERRLQAPRPAAAPRTDA
jgi:hypothetical protein